LFASLKQFGPGAVSVLVRAQDGAQSLQHDRVDSGHLFLALVSDDLIAARPPLRSGGITAARVRDALLGDLPSHPLPGEGDLPFSPRAKSVLESALRRAALSGTRLVSPVDVLIALAESYVVAGAGPGTSSLAIDWSDVVADASTIDAREYAAFEQVAPPRTTEPEPDAQEANQPKPASVGENSTPSTGDRTAVATRHSMASLRVVVALVIVAQFAVFVVLSRDGWDSTRPAAAEAAAPGMEKVGAPPGLIGDYVAMTRMAFPIQGSRGRVLGTAAFAGAPDNWGGAAAQAPSVSPFSQSPAATLRNLTTSGAETLLFVVPLTALAEHPEFVVAQGIRHQLTVISQDAARGFAIAKTTVTNHQLSAFGSSVLWLTQPVPHPLPLGLMLIRRDPSTASFALTSGQLGQGGDPGTIRAVVGQAGVGTPVIGITVQLMNALVGFVEKAGPRGASLVPTSTVASLLRLVAPTVAPGTI
jgi:hypothetical protein